MDAITINFILTGIILVLLVFLSFIWPPDSPWSPWWKTDKRASQAIIDLAKIKNSDIVYELGSGDGEFALYTARITGANVVGIEIDPIRFYISKIRSYFSPSRKKIKFIKEDFKKIDISETTVLYFYLVPAAIKRIMPKLKKELKPGTKAVSYRYKVEGLKFIAENKEHKLYLYKF